MSGKLCIIRFAGLVILILLLVGNADPLLIHILKHFIPVLVSPHFATLWIKIPQTCNAILIA
jgi:hypothetical protein